MVESEQDAISGNRRIILSPNSSMTRRQANFLLAGMGLFMASIALGFAGLGLWPVLPFSGAEWLLPVYCFRLSFRNAAVSEVITITDAAVKLEKCRIGPEQTYRFQRAWVALDWNRSPIKGHPSRLSFRLHGKNIEFGCFLVETEREALARELRKILLDGK